MWQYCKEYWQKMLPFMKTFYTGFFLAIVVNLTIYKTLGPTPKVTIYHDLHRFVFELDSRTIHCSQARVDTPN